LLDAKNIPINDEDMDEVHSNLKNLNLKVSSLLKAVETNNNRRLD